MVHLIRCQTFQHIQNEKFDGIINFFNIKYDEKQLNELIVVDSSSTIDGRSKPNVVINHNDIENSHKDWVSDNIENSNITIHFLKHKIRLSSYSLLGRYDHDFNIPFNWTLEATNDYIEWETLSQYNNENEPLSQKKLMNIPLSQQTDKYYSIFRITHLGVNTIIDEYNNRFVFAFRAIDFYGSICNDNSFCVQQTKIAYNFTFILSFLVSIML